MRARGAFTDRERVVGAASLEVRQVYVGAAKDFPPHGGRSLRRTEGAGTATASRSLNYLSPSRSRARHASKFGWA